LPPLVRAEIEGVSDYIEHWLRGGFPNSLLAGNDVTSMEWRINFIQSYLERDLPLLGLKADPMLIRQLWTMSAHLNGNLLNMEKLAGSLGISGPTVRRYLDFMESAYLIRRLSPYFFNIKKRLVKSPKLFIRDTGILHALLNIGSRQQLMGHPALGGSWEAYILQEIAAMAPPRTELFFYRTQDGTEADLVIAPGGIPASLVEIKFTSTPKAERGFQIAIADLSTTRNFIVCPVETGYPISDNISVLGYRELGKLFEA
jgi:predicted AAA+ superfamily ATPase